MCGTKARGQVMTGIKSVPILSYHALSEARSEGFYRWTLSAQRLAGHLDYLAREGYRTLTISALAKYFARGGPRPGERLIALTFDDAYADFHTVALPLLARYQMTATLFVPTGYVGAKSLWMSEEGEGERRIASWAALREIAEAGLEIGAHSHTHAELDLVSSQELTGQLSWPKAELEQRLGRPVQSMAYPYGRYNRRVRVAVAQAGYLAACTMNSWAATRSSNLLELPRIPVFQHTDAADLAQRLFVSRSAARREMLRAQRAAHSAVGSAAQAASVLLSNRMLHSQVQANPSLAYRALTNRGSAERDGRPEVTG